jgi:hypothetical protein
VLLRARARASLCSLIFFSRRTMSARRRRERADILPSSTSSRAADASKCHSVFSAHSGPPSEPPCMTSRVNCAGGVRATPAPTRQRASGNARVWLRARDARKAIP